jgi:hypothetical protein
MNEDAMVCDRCGYDECYHAGDPDYVQTPLTDYKQMKRIRIGAVIILVIMLVTICGGIAHFFH